MAAVTFEKCSLPDHIASAEQGRAIFAEGIRATVHIDAKSNIIFDFIAPREGEGQGAFERRMPPEIKLNWRKELQSWLDGQEHVDGTPIEQMPWLTPAQAANLKSAGLPSVERLAECSDGLLAPLGLNGAVLRAQARAWLDKTAGQAVASVGKLQQENEELKAALQEQARAIAALQDQAKPARSKAAADKG